MTNRDLDTVPTAGITSTKQMTIDALYAIRKGVNFLAVLQSVPFVGVGVTTM